MSALREDSATLAREICACLAHDKPVRRNLPGAGSIAMDRLVPFLCVYRSPPDRDDAGTRELMNTEAAYLFASGDERHEDALAALVGGISELAAETLGGFLLVEVWEADLAGRGPGDGHLPRLAFRVGCGEPQSKAYATGLARELRAIRFGYEEPDVSVALQESAPPGMAPLLGGADARVLRLAIEVQPIYRNDGQLFPALLREIRAQFSRALRRTVFEFARAKTRHPPAHFHEMGPRALLEAVGTFAERLIEVSEAFDFLFQVTPINVAEAGRAFEASGYEKAPILHYRPLPYETEEVKRKLFEIPLDSIEDPTLAFLLGERQIELDRQLSALRDIGTRDFLYGCLQLYGEPDDALLALARRVLEHEDAGDEAGDAPGAGAPRCETAELVRRAHEEIAYYRSQDAGFDPQVEIRSDLASDLLVSRGALYVSETAHVSRARVHALLQHEVGTHLVSYFNGSAQTGLAQLRGGLAGYETLQEGLAVLSECLAGGLTRCRARVLAARVLAARWVIRGADFVEVFRRLAHDYAIPRTHAARITLRAFRGGGFIKDAIYLRGFREIMRFLEQGRDLAPLFVGKLALSHLPYIEELRHRAILRPPRLLPRYLQESSPRARLESLRGRDLLEVLTNGPGHGLLS